jgi:putative drug exporter of the RND superfamily
MLDTCDFTVAAPMKSSSEIAALLDPRAIATRTSRSRSVRRSKRLDTSLSTASRLVNCPIRRLVIDGASRAPPPATVRTAVGLGAILVVTIAVAASLTLLPAVLSVMGDRLEALRIRGRKTAARPRGRFWARIATSVMRRPIISLVLAGGVLIAAALPYLGINEGFSGVSTLPDEADSKRAFVVMEGEFSGGLSSPVEVVIDGSITPKTIAAIQDLRETLQGHPTFGPSEVEMNDARDVALVSVPLTGDIAANDAMGAVRELREEIVPRLFDDARVDVLVGGETAYNVDYLDQTTFYTPIVFAFVLGLSFVLLTVAFRSLVMPLKAIAMNLLSVGAAYGLVVLFFQQGAGPEIFKDIAGWLGFGQVEAIEAGMPLFMFSVLFGLSMDYHVYLLSRIRERFDDTGNNAQSDAYGLRTTGSLITGAAAIMVAVFGGFAAGPLVGVQQWRSAWRSRSRWTQPSSAAFWFPPR